MRGAANRNWPIIVPNKQIIIVARIIIRMNNRFIFIIFIVLVIHKKLSGRVMGLKQSRANIHCGRHLWVPHVIVWLV
ncbi:hypothetical protein DC487_14325 [Sphingobacterium corticibacter]|uniref:Uncharacterized protein n=1 Tax=Sphingobacterium corticibacter TaxID=2171749 RepID=A0A2T8HFP1_9SPHI|nr:hypothetical protein DC487_14325 [Sphingobacterium corticibacter]